MVQSTHPGSPFCQHIVVWHVQGGWLTVLHVPVFLYNKRRGQKDGESSDRVPETCASSRSGGTARRSVKALCGVACPLFCFCLYVLVSWKAEAVTVYWRFAHPKAGKCAHASVEFKVLRAFLFVSFMLSHPVGAHTLLCR